MAITTILERLLLNGQAKNKIHHIAFGSFSQIQIPPDSFIVIHKIYWNGFLNQKDVNVYAKSWKEFFKYNEYQLKVQSDKENPIYYILRNEVNFNYVGNPGALRLMNAPINDAQYDDFILMTPKKPVIFDTFITAYDYLNFTISRNELLPVASNFIPVNQYANEKNVPDGVNGENVLITVDLLGTNGTVTNYNPVSAKDTPTAVTLQPRNTENYHQDLDKQVPGVDNGSFIDNPIGGLKLKHSEFVTNPLISLEYCLVQKNVLNSLSPL
jgi:hypothetical protein